MEHRQSVITVSGRGDTSTEVSTAEPVPGQSCLNCDADVTDSYCSVCGQRARTTRTTLPRLLRDFGDHLLSFDSHALRTLRALFTRPGTFIRAFLLGRRVGYARPLPYYLLAVALNVGVSSVLRPSAVPGGANQGSFWDQNFVALQIGVAFGLLMLPVAAARRLLHRGAGYSVAEHFSFLLYVLAQSIVMLLSVKLLLWPLGMRLSGDAEGLTWLATFSGYVVWASRGFLVETRWKVVLKLIAAFIILLACMAVVGLIWKSLFA